MPLYLLSLVGDEDWYTPTAVEIRPVLDLSQPPG